MLWNIQVQVVVCTRTFVFALCSIERTLHGIYVMEFLEKSRDRRSRDLSWIEWVVLDFEKLEDYTVVPCDGKTGGFIFSAMRYQKKYFRKSF